MPCPHTALCLCIVLYLTVQSSGFPEQGQEVGICNGFVLRSLWVLNKFCIRILLRMTYASKFHVLKTSVTQLRMHETTQNVFLKEWKVASQK